MKAPFHTPCHTRGKSVFRETRRGAASETQFPRNSSIVIGKKVPDESTIFFFVYSFNDNRNYTTLQMLITLPWAFTTWFLTSFLWSTNRLENWKLAVDNQRGMVLSLNPVIWFCLCLCDRRRRHMARYKSSIAVNITLPFHTFIMFFSFSIEKLSKRLLIWKPFFFLYNSGTSCRSNVRQRLFN